jgi:hypothetical protein
MSTDMKSAFETYSELEISKELKLKIRNEKNKTIAIRYPNGGMTTEDHEQILIEACAVNGIIL